MLKNFINYVRSDVKAILNASIVRQSVLFEKFKKNGIKYKIFSHPDHDLLMITSLHVVIVFTAELYTYMS